MKRSCSDIKLTDEIRNFECRSQDELAVVTKFYTKDEWFKIWFLHLRGIYLYLYIIVTVYQIL